MPLPGDAISIEFRERRQQRDAAAPREFALTPRGFSAEPNARIRVLREREYGYGYRSSG